MPKRDLYSLAERTRTADGGRIGQYPQFRLETLPDDGRRPREITVYPRASPNTTTEWLTAAIEDAVPIGRCR